RSASRSSNHSRQSQGFQPSGGYNKHNSGPKSGSKPHETNASGDSSAAAFQPHHQDGAAYQSNPPLQQHQHQHQYQHQQPVSVPMPTPPSHSSAPMPGQPQPQPQQPQQQQHQGPHYGGSPYRGHVRPPHSQGHTQAHSGSYKPQGSAHYPQHHMGTQPMSQPMGYPMPAPAQPPMQQAIMTTQPGMPPMQGWMPPPPQFAYMPISASGYEQYYRQPQGAAGSSPQGMYGMPSYSMPAPQHAVAPQMGPGGLIPGSHMQGAPMPGMGAAPMAGQQPPHHAGGLSASAQAFVPGRRPVRIVDPNTNQEVDISSQRLRSASAASSAHQNAPSGTASPAPGATAAAIADKRDMSGTPVENSAAAEEPQKPKFKIPVNRAIRIVDPNTVAKTKDEEETAKVEVESKTEIKAETETKAETEAETKVEIESESESETETETKIETKPEMKAEAEQVAEPKAQDQAIAENKAVEQLADTLATTKISEDVKEADKPTAVVEEKKPAEAIPAESKEQKEPTSVPESVPVEEP
ncbi:hypothetical protein J3B02_004719, partial [Coemansia erecta]